nr:LPD7 domain-containing protein [uncultured Brevundimonas sp.]
MTATRDRRPADAHSIAPAASVDPARRSRTKGDVPQSVMDRYLVERDLRGRAERFYRDHRAAQPHFRDRGGSLSTDNAYPDAITDMLRIAQHRGWSRVKVSGDEVFRREVWIQARKLGLEVSGHRPRDRDRQAAGVPLPHRDLPDRLARAAVVVARLIPDPAAQARLLERALNRARSHEPTKGRERDR